MTDTPVSPRSMARAIGRGVGCIGPGDDKLQRKIKKRDMLNRQIEEEQARRNKKKRSMENHRKILAGTADEWTFEDGVGVVIARHASGFTVSLPTYLGLKAKVLADAGYKSQRDRTRLIMSARRALRKLHGGRDTWETTETQSGAGASAG
jgi:hypothetical protein